MQAKQMLSITQVTCFHSENKEMNYISNGICLLWGRCEVPSKWRM